jgi:protein ImuA
MNQLQTKQDILTKLRQDILVWEGFKAPVAGKADSVGLGAIETAFPNGIFPKGAIHEFLSGDPENAAASDGFIAAVLQALMKHNGICLWISKCRTLFPPALRAFGIEPDRIIFMDLKRERDVLWVTEEALKCEGLSAVISEVTQISFAESRRLQLAVEKSRVTGFIVRNDPQKLSSTPCVARWRITPLPSELHEGMPGVGFPRWNVELLKVRNGNPGVWKMEWSANKFTEIKEKKLIPLRHQTERQAV